jgi:hypothetical protein
MKEHFVIDFLDAFFSLFNASIENYIIKENTISGLIGWNNEIDKQEFLWNFAEIDFINTRLQDICELISYNKLNEGDRITISEENMLSFLVKKGWDINVAKRTMELLFTIEIKMVDEGKETDSFFLHI